MKDMVIRRSLCGAFVLLWLGCAGGSAAFRRPAPVIGQNFESQRPLVAAVMPAVYLPEKKLRRSASEVFAREYTRYFYHPETVHNPVLQALEDAVRAELEGRGIQIVPDEEVEKRVMAMNPRRGLNWQILARDLKVDSFVFITLYHWEEFPPRAASTDRTVGVSVEVAISNAAKQAVIFQDRNFPSVEYVPRDDNQGIRNQIVAKAVASAFAKFPL